MDDITGPVSHCTNGSTHHQPGNLSRHHHHQDQPSSHPTETIGQESRSTLGFDLEDATPPVDNKFAFSPAQLHKLHQFKSAAVLDAFGGIRGLATGLRTDLHAGISAEESGLQGNVSFADAVAAGRAPPAGPSSSSLFTVLQGNAHHTGSNPSFPRSVNAPFADRHRIFGPNRLPRRLQKSFLRLMWVAFNDKLLILLTISALISLAIGIYQTIDVDSSNSHIEWINGFTVIVAILVIVLASAATDWQKNHKFAKLNERKDQRSVTAIRSGRASVIAAQDVVVGDVLHVDAGDIVVVDGVLIESSNLRVDESSVSGESDLVSKRPVAVQTDPRGTNTHCDFLIWGGTLVSCGVGRYLVTAVGVNSTYGKTFTSLGEDVQKTPLQVKLGRMGKQLITFGAVAGTIFFAILFVRYLINLQSKDNVSPSQKAEDFFHILILSVAVVIITVPEGLALNVAIALAFATKRMLKDNNLVRLLRSCEVMGNATCVCSDKTGTLTQNKMTVVTGRIGREEHFDDQYNNRQHTTSRDTDTSAAPAPSTSAPLMASLSSDAKALLKSSIALNSTAFESHAPTLSEFVGSSTETALLKFARDHLGLQSLAEERANHPVVSMLPFDPSRKWMGCLFRLPNGQYRLLVKGAAEIVFEYSAYVLSDPTWELPAERLSEEDRSSFRATIRTYARQMLRPVALAYRDFDETELFISPSDGLEEVNIEWLASGLILTAVLGIRDSLRPRVVESVRQCQDAGVFARMVTGDNFVTAKTVAAECGIYTAGGVAMDGPTFRRLSTEQLSLIVPRLQVLARSSPQDKLKLVMHLKDLGETVAVTGDGTNDSLALKAADVGFAMGIQGTEVAKEAASIILLDDNFASIVKAVSWGRTVVDAVKRFCQFQFTINITASIIAVVSELAGNSIFTVVQLLWINLIMDVFASLGLATDHPSSDALRRPPEPRNAPLVSVMMWKMIIGQAIYQLIVVLTVHYAGWDLFNLNTDFEVEKLQTFVFNIYMFMQLFNQHNCRRVDNKLEIWDRNLLRNPWFIGVQFITVAGQFLIVFLGGQAFDTRRLTGAQWGWSLLFGVLTIPLGALIRQVPDEWVMFIFLKLRKVFLILLSPFIRVYLEITQFRRRRLADGTTSSGDADSTNQPIEPASELVQSQGVTTSRNFPQQDGGRFADRIEPVELPDTPGTPERGHARNEDPESSVDLLDLIDRAKEGRPGGNGLLEIHPGTSKDDPALSTPSSAGLPPSQDPRIQRYIAKGRGHGNGRFSWQQTTEPINSRSVLTQETQRRGFFSADRLLRSRRR